MILGNITCSSHVCHTYNVLHWYDNVKMSQVFLIDFAGGVASLWWALSIPHGYVYDHFLFLKSHLGLPGARGTLHPFPLELTESSVVLVLSCLTLLALFAYVHTLVSETSKSAFNQTYEDSWSELT